MALWPTLYGSQLENLQNLGSNPNRLSENASFLKFTHNNKGNTVAKVKMDDIIMSKNENHKPKPHQATQSIL